MAAPVFPIFQRHVHWVNFALLVEALTLCSRASSLDSAPLRACEEWLECEGEVVPEEVERGVGGARGRFLE